jgi:hypothetical protein
MCDVVHKDSKSYGDEFQIHLIEQYKIIRQSIVDVGNDRNNQNKFLLGLLTAVLSIPLIFLQTRHGSSINISLLLLALSFPVFGAAISILWIFWNKTYKEALGALYQILHKMEEHLPAKPYTVVPKLRDKEAKEAGHKRHRLTSDIMIWIPWILLIANVMLLILSVLFYFCGGQLKI